MVVDLIKSKVYLGKSMAKVRKELGEATGYFENDGIYSYILTPESKSNDEAKEVWQVVFLPDSTWKKVKEIKIHKNCCSK